MITIPLSKVHKIINKKIKLARKVLEHRVSVVIYGDHNFIKIIEQLAICGYQASAKRCYDYSYPDLTIIEYEIDL